MIKIIHKHRRWVQKFAINTLRSISYSLKEPKTENEGQVISICKNVIRKEDTILSISPITIKRIIKNDNMGIKIVIKDELINISGGYLPYKNKISKKGFDFILSIFDNEIEKRIDTDDKDIESLYNDIIKSNLKEMLNKIRK